MILRPPGGSVPPFLGAGVALGEEAEELLLLREDAPAVALSRHMVPRPPAAAAELLCPLPEGTGAKLFSMDITRVLM